MGTTLTGTTPQDTYDSLIKVTDNGPLTGSLKKLTDGLGNDSALSLSTSAASIAGTLAVSSTISATNTISVTGADATGTNVGIVNTSAGGVNYNIFSCGSSGTLAAAGSLAFRDSTIGATRLVITSAGNVGIGTSSPNFILEAAGTTGIGVRSEGVDGVYTDILSSVYSANANEQNAIQTSVSGVAGNSGFRFQVSDGSGLTTQTLGYQLNKDRHVFYTNGSERVRVTTDGLTFNGDTAAANALDDYEEGTWTMGVSFGGASTGVTYTLNSGTYTKIGRQVTVNGVVVLSSKGSSTGTARISGLPFTVGSGLQFSGSAALRTANITFTDSYSMEVIHGTTTISFTETTTAGALNAMTDTNFANNANIAFTATYFV
jgi:hypothetical protein